MNKYNGFKVEMILANISDISDEDTVLLLEEFQDKLQTMVEHNFKDRLFFVGGRGEYLKKENTSMD
ncbi:MAG: hypothetical protein ACRC1P_09730 [Cellulosilyticaceae bacterium]